MVGEWGKVFEICFCGLLLLFCCFWVMNAKSSLPLDESFFFVSESYLSDQPCVVPPSYINLGELTVDAGVHCCIH